MQSMPTDQILRSRIIHHIMHRNVNRMRMDRENRIHIIRRKRRQHHRIKLIRRDILRQNQRHNQMGIAALQAATEIEMQVQHQRTNRISHINIDPTHTSWFII